MTPWTVQPEDIPRSVPREKREQMLQRLADLPNQHRFALMTTLPDSPLSRDIIMDVARVQQNAHNQAQLTAWIVSVHQNGHKRPRPGGRHPARPWKARRPRPVALNSLAKKANRVGEFLRWLGARPYGPPVGANPTWTDEFVDAYFKHRKQGKDRKPGSKVVESCNIPLGWKMRNRVRQEIHHFVHDLHGAAAAEAYCPWKMEDGQDRQGASTWAPRARIDAIVEAYAEDEYGLVVRLCRAGFDPKTATTRMRDDIRFRGGRLHVRTDRGWFSVPADPRPFARRIASMLEAGDSGFIVRGPFGQGHADQGQHTTWHRSQRTKCVALGKISRWGAANMLMLGYTPLYVARMRKSTEAQMTYLLRDAKSAARPGDFEAKAELQATGAYGFSRCTTCSMTQALTGFKHQRCASCHGILKAPPLDSGLVRLLHATTRHERYVQAANRTLEQDAERLLKDLGWTPPIGGAA